MPLDLALSAVVINIPHEMLATVVPADTVAPTMIVALFYLVFIALCLGYKISQLDAVEALRHE